MGGRQRGGCGRARPQAACCGNGMEAGGGCGMRAIDHQRHGRAAWMRAWVFKINTRRGWEFDQYFRSRGRGPFPLGDEEWIRSASSLRYLRTEVKAGDVIFCYEVDRKRIVGVAPVVAAAKPGDGAPLLSLAPPTSAVRLQNPVERKPWLDHILAFTPQRGRGTVQPFDSDEFAHLRRILAARNPRQKAQLGSFWKNR
jgi:hypothetical protein